MAERPFYETGYKKIVQHESSLPEPVETKPWVCDTCGLDMTNWSEGSWPWCKGDPSAHKVTSRLNLSYDEFQSFVDERLQGNDVGPTRDGSIVKGVKLESREQRDRIMKERNLFCKDNVKLNKVRGTVIRRVS